MWWKRDREGTATRIAKWCGVRDATGMRGACLAREASVLTRGVLRAVGGQGEVSRVIWHPRERGDGVQRWGTRGSKVVRWRSHEVARWQGSKATRLQASEVARLGACRVAGSQSCEIRGAEAASLVTWRPQRGGMRVGPRVTWQVVWAFET